MLVKMSSIGTGVSVFMSTSVRHFVYNCFSLTRFDFIINKAYLIMLKIGILSAVSKLACEPAESHTPFS